jgi:hypothetical protein
MKQPRKPSAQRLRQRTAEIRRKIAAMDYACSGTLHSRTRPCGKPNCRCAADADAWHGPYHDWSRRKDGRLAHAALSAEQALLVRRGITNRREIERLLALWEEETVDEILSPDDASGSHVRR